MIDEIDLALLKRNDGETSKDYRLRCYTYHRDNPNVTWGELATIMNAELNEKHDKHAYQRQYKNWVKYGMFDTKAEDSEPVIIDCDDTDRLLQMKKLKVQLSEERTQTNAYIRKLSREDTIKEIANNFAEKMSTKKLLDTDKLPLTTDSDREAILCISDWHYGIDVKNYFNTYNPEVCRYRVYKLLHCTIEKCVKENVSKIHVVNLSDLIAGRIHLSLRLESREDVISQIMTVSEILAEFLTELSTKFEVDYRDVTDNHSRLEPNKKDSLELETLVRIVPWYLRQRLMENDRINILDNDFADDIVSFKIFDWSIVGVHGHKDAPNKVVQNMIAMTRQRADLVLTAHYHHFSAEEENECIRLSNGTLMGVDTYANDLRLTSTPSQNLIIVSKTNPLEVLYKINVS